MAAQELRPKQTLDMDTVMASPGSEEELTGLPAPMPAEGNQERLAALGMARPAGSAKAELTASSAATPDADLESISSPLEGVGNALRSGADGAAVELLELEGQSRQVTVFGHEVISDKFVASNKPLFASDIGRYQSLATRADSLSVQDAIATALWREARESSDEALAFVGLDGADLELATAKDTSTLQDGLQGATVAEEPASRGALDAVRLSVGELGAAAALASAATANLRAAALRKQAGAKEAERQKIVELLSTVDALSGLVGTVEKMVPTLVSVDPKAAVGAMFREWYAQDLADLQAQVATLGAHAGALELSAEQTRLEVAITAFPRACEQVQTARQLGQTALAADQQAWQATGIRMDDRAVASGRLEEGQEAGVGAALRIAKVEQASEMLRSARQVIGPVAQQTGGFAEELTVFAGQGSGIQTLTSLRESMATAAADPARSAAQGLRIRAAAADARTEQLAGASGLVAGLRDANDGVAADVR